MPGNDELQKLLGPSRYGPSQAPTIPARDDTFWPAGNHRFGDVSVGGFGEDPTLAALLGKPASEVTLHTIDEDLTCVEPSCFVVERDELAEALARPLVLDTFWPGAPHRFGDFALDGFGEDTSPALRGKPASEVTLHSIDEVLTCVEPSRFVVERDELAEALARTLVVASEPPVAVSADRQLFRFPSGDVEVEESDTNTEFTVGVNSESRFTAGAKHEFSGGSIEVKHSQGIDGRTTEVAGDFKLGKSGFKLAVSGERGVERFVDSVTGAEIKSDNLKAAGNIVYETNNKVWEFAAGGGGAKTPAALHDNVPVYNIFTRSFDFSATRNSPKYDAWSVPFTIAYGQDRGYLFRANNVSVGIGLSGSLYDFKRFWLGFDFSLNYEHMSGMFNAGQPNQAPFRSGKLSFEAGLKFTPGRRKKRP
jgi:hypothetical protein